MIKATFVISIFGLLFFQRFHALTVAQAKLTNLKFYIYQGEGFYKKYSETERDQLVDKIDHLIFSLRYLTISRFIVCLIFFKLNNNLLKSLNKNQLLQKLAVEDLKSIGKTLNWLIVSRSFFGVIFGTAVFSLLYIQQFFAKRKELKIQAKSHELKSVQQQVKSKETFIVTNNGVKSNEIVSTELSIFNRISKLVIETVLAFRSNNGHRLFGKQA